MCIVTRSMVSMFIANNAPLMAALVKGVSAASGQNPKVKDVIATIANVCCNMVGNDKYDLVVELFLDCIHQPVSYQDRD